MPHDTAKRKKKKASLGVETACSFSAVLSEVLGGAQGSWVQGTDAQRTGTGVQVVSC